MNRNRKAIGMENNNCFFTNSDRIYYATDFLIYSVLGISLNDFFTKKGDDKTVFILDRVISSAYRDASRHVLSKKTDKEEIGYNSDIEWKSKREKAENAIRDHILNLHIAPPTVDDVKDAQKIGLQEGYDIWHYQLCTKLLEIYNEDGKQGTFCFGIAQKWINMIMKYLVVLNSCMFISEDTYRDDIFPKEIAEMITKYIHLFHIPLDGIIKRALNKDEKKSLNDEESDLTDYYRYPKGKGLSVSYKWSKIVDYKNYFDIQKDIREKHNKSLEKIINPHVVPYTPIDWESAAWIAEARVQRDKDKKN